MNKVLEQLPSPKRPSRAPKPSMKVREAMELFASFYSRTVDGGKLLERLQKAGVKTYRTDMTGAVSFYLDGKSVTPDVALIR